MVSSTGISFSGLASGLDTTSIVNQLVALERIPIQLAEAQRDEQQDKLDRLSEFRGLVQALQTTADDLSTSEGFFQLSVSGDNPDVAVVSAGSGGNQGTHSVDVQQLAGVDRWAFDGVADPETDLASAAGRTVSFSVGDNDYEFTFGTEDSSLNEIVGTINGEASEDVNASIVNTGTDADPTYQLVLSATGTGEEGRINNISSSVDGLNIDYSAPTAGGEATSSNNLTVGTNAVAVIDGLEVTRTDNDFSDVIPGVTLDVVGVGVTNFTVEPNREGIREQIDQFVDAYNEVQTFINTQSTFTPSDEDGEAGSSGALFGDSILSSVRSAIQRGLFNVPIEDLLADEEGFSTLSNVGIELDNDGLLSINEELFDEKLAANLDAFADLFTDTDGFVRDPDALENTSEYYVDTTADSGLFASLERELDRLFGSLPSGSDSVTLSGIFDLRRSTFESNIERINDDVTEKERRLEEFESDQILRFARLEELMGQLNAQGASLAASLGG